jgi:hypothetical protein
MTPVRALWRGRFEENSKPQAVGELSLEEIEVRSKPPLVLARIHQSAWKSCSILLTVDNFPDQNGSPICFMGAVSRKKFVRTRNFITQS